MAQEVRALISRYDTDWPNGIHYLLSFGPAIQLLLFAPIATLMLLLVHWNGLEKFRRSISAHEIV